MKMRRKFAAVLAAALILSGSFPVSAAQDTPLPGESKAEQENTEETAQDASSPEESKAEQENTEEQSKETAQDASSPEESKAEQENTEEQSKETAQDASSPEEPEAEQENTGEQNADTVQDEVVFVEAKVEQANTEEAQDEEIVDADDLIPAEAPAFHARIEWRMGYAVIGTFTDFTSDVTNVQPLYSLDGEDWQTGPGLWNLFNLGTDDEDKLKTLQNQNCFLECHEPLKSYITGTIDHFYLKLRITKRNGLSYETQSTVIERGGVQSIPEGAERRALFSNAIAASERVPSGPVRFRRYGKYQITVYADSTAEEISALLPDTLPVEIQLDNGSDFIAKGYVDCPVTWKTLSLPALSEGECVVIPDAAEEIIVPGGMCVSTPIGIFELDEPLGLNMAESTDEVRLVLNVSTERRNPTEEVKTESGEQDKDQEPNWKPSGAGGNEGNVGAGNKGDSTESGQRPDLPQMPDNDQEKLQAAPMSISEDDQKLQQSDPESAFEDDQKEQQLIPVAVFEYSGQEQQLDLVPLSEDDGQKWQPVPAPVSGDVGTGQQPDPAAHTPETTVGSTDSGQRPNLPRTTPDAADALSADQKDEESAAKDIEDEEVSIEHTAQRRSSVAILPVTTAAAACGCVGVAVCKATGYGLFRRLAEIMRKMLHK